jgi:hypothetical protein
MVADVLIWVLLYATPGKLPVYISVWQTEAACQVKAKAIAQYFDQQGHPEYGLFCVREKLRDSGDPND